MSARGLPLALLLVACGPGTPEAASEPAGPRSAGAEEAGYRIVLTHAAHAGDRYHVRTVHRRQMVRQVRAGGAVTGREVQDRTVDLAAWVTVEAVNAGGVPTASRYEVESASLHEGEGERALLPAGAVLEVRRVAREGERGSIELVGGGLSDADREGLELVIPTGVPALGDDAVFGTRERQSVGSSWPMDVEAAAVDLNKGPLQVRPDQLQGRMRLEAVEEVDGVPCLRVRGRVTARGFGMAGLPEGSRVLDSTLTMEMTGAFPVGGRAARLEESQEASVALRMAVPTPGGREAIVEVGMHDVERSHFHR